MAAATAVSRSLSAGDNVLSVYREYKVQCLSGQMVMNRGRRAIVKGVKKSKR